VFVKIKLPEQLGFTHMQSVHIRMNSSLIPPLKNPGSAYERPPLKTFYSSAAHKIFCTDGHFCHYLLLKQWSWLNLQWTWLIVNYLVMFTLLRHRFSTVAHLRTRLI